MMDIRRISCVMALTLASLCSFAKASAPFQRIYKTPIQLSTYNLIFTNIQVNGKEVLALIDSGSSRPIEISSTLARELKMPLTEDKTRTIRGHDGKPFYLSKGHLQTLTVGDYEQRSLEVEVAGDHIETISKQVNTPFQVILGWSFLSQTYAVVDYKALTLQFSAAPFELGKSVIGLNYSVINNVPIVKGFFEKMEVNLLFDTGAPMCNIDAEYAKVSIGEKVSRELSIGENKLMIEWRVKDLAVIKRSLSSAGVIGNNLLSRYRIYFDTKNMMIYLS